MLERVVIATSPWAAAGLMVAAVAAVAFGAHWMVDSASRLAKRVGVSELIVGLTIVAMGTSSPELAVSLIAAFGGKSDVSVGNIIGSNIFNLGFILGGCALFGAIPTPMGMLRRDGLVLLLGGFLLLGLVGADLGLGQLDGGVFLGSLACYVALLFWQRRADLTTTSPENDPPEPDTAPLWRHVAWDLGLVLGGLFLILAGSRVMVLTATEVATTLGISEWVIGVTVVAAGTSVPELATSLVAAMKRNYGISAGSLIGSDIFNIFGVLGVAGLVSPMSIDPAARGSLVAMTLMTALVLVFMRTGWRLTRTEGGVLVVCAVARWAYDLSLAP
ncbi:MAG: calcium/sodium antiporter [Myxococcales bacterium FL481]|nr:MAG: calcium/sodium antiporter [Myxococcales bacterium FL481]